MKIYVYDTGWQGAVICVAENKEEALKKMIAANKLDQEYFDRNQHRFQLDEHDLDDVIETVGDNLK